MRLLLETLDKTASHSYACTCSAMAIVCACVGSVLYVLASSWFPLNAIRWAIFARVRL